MGTNSTNSTAHIPSVLQNSEIVQEQHIHGERHQDQGQRKEEEGDQVDYHLKVTAVTGVPDGEQDLSNFCVLPVTRTTGSTTQFLTGSKERGHSKFTLEASGFCKKSESRNSCYNANSRPNGEKGVRQNRSPNKAELPPLRILMIHPSLALSRSCEAPLTRRIAHAITFKSSRTAKVPN